MKNARIDMSGPTKKVLCFIYLNRKEDVPVRGKVKWFNNEKGFGFIEYNNEEDIFVHYSAILSEGYKTLVEGQYVEFDLVRTDKGLQAKNVVEQKATLV